MRRTRQRDPSKWTSKACPTCNKSFEYLLSWPRKYCSNICSGKASITNIPNFTPTRFTAVCEQCKEVFETTPKATRGRFCSRKCWGQWLIGKNVGERSPNYGRKFNRPKNPISKPCSVCGKNFLTKRSDFERRQTCSRDCALVVLASRVAGENNFNWMGGYEPYYGPTWRPARRAVRKRDKVCGDCGKTPEENGKALDVHHIVPFRAFGIKGHSEANALTNLLSLCPACHSSREPRLHTNTYPLSDGVAFNSE